MPTSSNEGLLKLIQGISLFKGFTPQEAQLVLRVAKSRKCNARQIIYNVGEPSTEMLILAKGALVVQSEKGVNIARIEPGESVGEIGVLTDAPRSARVIAAEESVGLVIQKKELMNLLRSEKDLCIKFQSNVIDLLARRLRSTDKLVDTLADDRRI